MTDKQKLKALPQYIKDAEELQNELFLAHRALTDALFNETLDILEFRCNTNTEIDLELLENSREVHSNEVSEAYANIAELEVLLKEIYEQIENLR